MAVNLLKELPFNKLNDEDFRQLLSNDGWKVICDNHELSDFVSKLNMTDVLKDLNFEYATCEEINSSVRNFSDSVEFSVFHLNIRSLNANHKHLCQLLALLEVQFDVIVLTEIWSTNIQFYENILRGYNFYYDLPIEGKVGGVGLYVKNVYTHHHLPSFKLPNSVSLRVENIWIEVVKNTTKYIIGGIYRHPNTRITDFKDSMDVILSNLSTQKSPCFIAGDINIDISKCNVSKDTAEYVENLIINNFMPTIIMPTRITPTTATLIDHIYYYPGSHNSKNITLKSGNILSDVTDHLPNYTLITSKKVKSESRPYVRIFSPKNKLNFLKYLRACDWNQIYQDDEVNTAYGKFLSFITSAFNSSFKFVKLSRKRSRDKPWITSALKKSSKIKNKLYKKWILTRNKDDECAYKRYKKVYTRVAAEAQDNHYREMFDIRNNSVKKLWNNLNIVCSFKHHKSKINISNLVINGCKTNDNLEICNGLNDYFSTVGKKLVDELQCINRSVDSNEFKQYCDRPVKNSMFVQPVTASELLQLTVKLKNGKAPGFDQIGPSLVKEIFPVICEPLLHIFNLSLSMGIVPDQLKIAKIIPVYKKGDHSSACNYRPISLLSVFDKLLEQIMYSRLISFLNVNNVLYGYQFGFRQNHSTTAALLEVLDNIYQNLDNHNKILGIYLDLQKAFDTVNHDILLYKLHNYGVRGRAYDWFKNYLTNRVQFTCVNNISSTVAEITCGVPQGSVLGPLLFLIYINDIANAVPNEKVRLFADDTNLFLARNTVPSVVDAANNTMLKLNNWFLANKLSLNTDKTCYMVFPPDTSNSVKVYVNNVEIQKVTNCRYLGVVIDEDLKWTTHIEGVCNKLVKYTSIFYKLRDKLPGKILKNIYYAFVHPHILYSIEIYANTCLTYLDRLVKLNNKLLRILQNKPMKFLTDKLYLAYSTLTVPKLHTFQLLLFVHKVIHHPEKLPEVFQDYFEINNTFHFHHTRLTNDIHIFRVNTSFGKRALCYKIACMWNDLPAKFKCLKSTNLFKREIKMYLAHHL